MSARLKLSTGLTALAMSLILVMPTSAQGEREAYTYDADDVNDIAVRDLDDVPMDRDPLARPKGLNRNDWTLSFGGNFTHNSFDKIRNRTDFDASVRLGWNYADNLRITALVDMALSDPGLDRFMVAARPTFHFDLEESPRFVPYAGGGLGVSRVSNDDSETGVGIHGVGGLEFFVTPQSQHGISVFVEFSPELVFYGGRVGTTFRTSLLTGISMHW